jgi:hypothetical protein
MDYIQLDYFRRSFARCVSQAIRWSGVVYRSVSPRYQTLGRLGHELGLEGLLVPSAARRRGVNLVVFPANLSQQSAMEIINVGELPSRY